MGKPMTPSITSGQIGKLQDLIGAALRKSDLPGDIVQKVIESDGEQLVADMLASLYMRVEARANEIALHVTVDRTRTPEQALAATGRRLYGNDLVVDAMPRGEGDEVELVFFKPEASAYQNGLLLCQALMREYEKRNLVPDPIALAAFAKKDPAFCDAKPFGCQWQDADGNYCCATFDRWDDERNVYVNRAGGGWDDRWSFAGVRKKSSASAL